MFPAKNLDCIILFCVLFSSYLIWRVFKNVFVGGFLSSWFPARQLGNGVQLYVIPSLSYK